jgi:hypothetical protein
MRLRGSKCPREPCLERRAQFDLALLEARSRTRQLANFHALNTEKPFEFRGATSGHTPSKAPRVSQGRVQGEAMQALTLMVVYVLATATVQFIGFLISQVVDYEYPTLGLMTFLILFLGAFGVAWPIAVWITEWMIKRAGYQLETEQSGLEERQKEEVEFRARRQRA